MQEELMEKRNQIILGLAIVFTIFNYYLILISVESFQGFNVSGHPIFYMVPFAFSTYLCFGIVLISGILYLITKNEKFDLLLLAATQVGVIAGAITLLVGIIWSYVEWGYFWQWEARQTITLIMWLAYVSLLIFRGMLDEKDPDKRATLTAIFGIATSPSVPISNFVVGALHPAPQQTALGEGLGMLLMLNFLFIGTLSVLLIYISYHVNKIELRLKWIRRAKLEELEQIKYT